MEQKRAAQCVGASEVEEFLSCSRVAGVGDRADVGCGHPWYASQHMPCCSRLHGLKLPIARSREEHLQASVPADIPNGTTRMGSHRQQNLSRH
jgi:hypothetical protein